MTKPDLHRSQSIACLQRTGLTTSRKIQCAAAAVTGQHAPGSKTALSVAYERSRPTVHAVGAAESVLRAHFEAPLLGGTAVDVRVDDAQRRRAVVALRVLAPNALRPIEDLVALLCANLDTQAISDGDKREGVKEFVAEGEDRSSDRCNRTNCSLRTDYHWRSRCRENRGASRDRNDVRSAIRSAAGGHANRHAIRWRKRTTCRLNPAFMHPLLRGQASWILIHRARCLGGRRRGRSGTRDRGRVNDSGSSLDCGLRRVWMPAIPRASGAGSPLAY